MRSARTKARRTVTNLTALLCDYFDTALTADERIVMYTHIQEYGRVWLPYLADELPGADADAYIRYAAAIVELAEIGRASWGARV